MELGIQGTSALQMDFSPEAQAVSITRAAECDVERLIPQGSIITVSNDDEYRAEGRKLVEIKNRIKDLENQRTSIVKPINDGVKRINDLFKAGTSRLQFIHDTIEKPMKVYYRAQEEKRRVAEEAARKEQERIEREKREAAAAEQKRLEDIRKEKERLEQESQQASNPFAAFATSKKLEEATQAEAETVDAITTTLREAATVQVPVDYVAKPFAAGTSVRHNWKCRIVNAALIPRELMQPNETLLGQIARTQKENASVPGCEFYDDITIGAR
jgi:hypothetical protein